MSHWDFGRQAGGRPNAPQPAAPGPDAPADAAYPGNARTPGGPWRARDDHAPDDPWSAGYDFAPADSGAAGDGGWPAGDPWPADNGWTRDGRWPADGDQAHGWRVDGDQAGGWPPRAGLAGLGLTEEEAGESTGPYPLTYERDSFTDAGSRPAAPPLADGFDAWPAAPYLADANLGDTAVLRDNDDDAGYTVRTDDFAGERPGDAGRWNGAWPGRPGPGVAGRAGSGQVLDELEDDWAYEGNGRRRGGARRWLVPAVIVVAAASVGAATVLLTSGHPGGQAGQGAGRPAATRAATPRGTANGTASAAATPGGAALTIAAAQQVLAKYTTVNNEANAQRSDALLATVEAGSSYAIDAGLYQAQQAAGARPYPAFSPVQATYYIPRGEPAAGPRWFVVQVANAFTSNPAKVTSAEYLLFTQSAPGGPWQDAIEPYLLSGTSAPRVNVGADGLATAVSPDSVAVTVAPGQLPAVTAASLDGAGGQAAVTVPAGLADRANQRTWQAAVQGGQVSDAHSAATGADGQEFALLTADGGALVFYTDAAEVTITPPAGAQLQLTIPGFYSPGQALAQARVSYTEQFAAYDPPAAAGDAPRVVAAYSAITGAG